MWHMYSSSGGDNRDYMQELGIDGRTIPKWMLNKQDERVWN